MQLHSKNVTSAHSKSATSVHLQQLSLDHITDQTPMGGTVLASGLGATFRIWAPAAREVHVLWDYIKGSDGTWRHRQAGQLTRMEGGRWAGYVPTLQNGSRYMFYVVGPTGGTVGLNAIRLPGT